MAGLEAGLEAKMRSATLIVPSRRSRGGRRRRGPAPEEEGKEEAAAEKRSKEEEEEARKEEARKEEARKEEEEERVKRLAEAEERARLMRAEAERVKQVFLAGFEEDVVRFNHEVAKLRAKLSAACRFGQEDQFVKMLAKLAKLDAETEKVLEEMEKIAKRKARKPKADKKKKKGRGKEEEGAGAEDQEESKQHGADADGEPTKKKKSRLDSRLAKLLQTLPTEVAAEAARVVEKRAPAEHITAQHVQHVVSSAPARSIMESVVKRRLEHYGRDMRRKYEADIKAGRASSSGGPRLSPQIIALSGAPGGYPVCTASRQGQHNLVKHLLGLIGSTAVDVCDQTGIAPLLLAARAGYALTAKFLLDSGAFADAVDSGRCNALMLACQQDDRFYRSELARREKLISSLSHKSKAKKSGGKAAEEGDQDGGGGGGGGGPPILEFRPLNKDHSAVVKLLIGAGVNVNHRDMWGRSALIHAAECGNDAAIRQMIKAGARLDDCDNNKGWSPLHYAVFNGHFFAAYSLLKAGTDVDAVDDNNISPLILAAEGAPNRQLVELLLYNGANTGITSNYGSSAASLARNSGEAGIVELLRTGVKDTYDPRKVVVEFVTKYGERKRQRLTRRKRVGGGGQKIGGGEGGGDASMLIGAGKDGEEDDGFASGVEDIDSDVEEAADSEGEVSGSGAG
jgi:ankyrin repeat protein